MATTAATMPAIVPFWRRLREMVLYPSGMAAMVPIVLLGIGHILVFIPLGIIIVLLLTVAMYHYAFDCLRATADGRLEPPDSGLSDGGGLGWRLVGLIFIMFGLALICGLLLGPALGSLALLVLGLALPGATITLAMEQRLSAALNPLNWLSIVTRIGWAYLAAVGLCLVVFFSQGYAAALAGSVLPMFLAVIFAGIVSNYALVIAFHLLGYLVYQYHEELGFEPQRPRVLQALKRPDPDQDMLDESAALVRDGQPEAAARHLEAHLRGRGGTAAVHTQYRKLLRLNGENDALLRHGHEYLSILLGQEKARAAVDLLHECQAIDPTFAPARADEVTQLARLAADAGHAEVVLKLLSGFHKRFPRSADIAPNYLLVATLMHERLGQDDKARRLLLMLRTQYPDSPVMPAIEELLATVERMLAMARKPVPGA